MPRKLIEIKSLHGFTIKELIALEESYQKKSLKSLLRTVIMRYKCKCQSKSTHLL